jgi:hypothetical protein
MLLTEIWLLKKKELGREEGQKKGGPQEMKVCLHKFVKIMYIKGYHW